MPWTASILPGDLRNYSPPLTPDWRWDSALKHLHAGTDPQPWEDNGITEILRRLKPQVFPLNDFPEGVVKRRWPHFSMGYVIHLRGGPECDEIQARLLCEPLDVVAAKTGYPAEALAAYAEIFFDVLDVQGADDWLLFEAANVREWNRRAPTEGEIWKFMAIVGGPAIVDLLVNDFRVLSHPEDDPDHLLAESIRSLVRNFSATLRMDPAVNRPGIEDVQRLLADTMDCASPVGKCD